MTDWTDQARIALDHWLDRMVAEAPDDADKEEVREDLRAHVLRDIEDSGVAIVTEDVLLRIAARLGEPPHDSTRAPLRRAPEETGVAKNPAGGVFIGVFGVVLPLAALVVEALTSTWAGFYIDPIPTWVHAALILVVVAGNALAIAGPGTTARALATRRALIGAAAAVSGVYALAFFPGIPLGLVGLLFFGLGLLPLSPPLALIASIRASARLTGPPSRKLLGVSPTAFGAIAATVILLAFEARGLLVAHFVDQALANDESARATAVARLRALGGDGPILAAIHRGPRVRNVGSLLPIGVTIRRDASPDGLAELYFRVTGEAPPPAVNPVWDAGVSMFGVPRARRFAPEHPVRITGSRIDGVVDSIGATAYFEWTMTLRGAWNPEATIDVLLPPGGVVSRATLWVKDEPREAAFSGRRQVQEAYEQVVASRRDPLLVTTLGADRVRIRGFPIPAEEDFKFRVGITAPLVLTGVDRALVVPPRIESANADVAITHAVWIESDAAFDPSAAYVIAPHAGKSRHVARAQVANADLGRPASHLAIAAPERGAVFSADALTPTDGAVVVQRVVEEPAKPHARVVFVVDGGAGMRDYGSEVEAAILGVPDGVDFGVVRAGDTPETIAGGCRHATRETLREVADQVASRQPEGGIDAAAAIARGFDLAGAVPRAAVVWIHAGVARALRAPVDIVQTMERSPGDPKFYDVALAPGPDAVGDALPQQRVQRVFRTAGIADDLARELGFGGKAVARPRYVRARVPRATVPEGAREASAHVARLWAHQRILETSFPVRAETLGAAIDLARTFQLVTPVSGAVVLETDAQFSAAKLEPADPTTTPQIELPSVPEPHEWALLAVCALALLWAMVSRTRTLRCA